MQGLRLKSSSFHDIFARLPTEAASHLFWILELAGGPFVTAGQPAHVVAEVQRHAVGVSRQLWRPCVFQKFAHLVWSDEWGYFLGVRGPEDRAAQTAAELDGLSWPADLFTEPAVKSVELLVIELEPGEWEVYTPHLEWLDPLRGSLPSKEVDSQAGEWVD